MEEEQPEIPEAKKETEQTPTEPLPPAPEPEFPTPEQIQEQAASDAAALKSQRQEMELEPIAPPAAETSLEQHQAALLQQIQGVRQRIFETEDEGMSAVLNEELERLNAELAQTNQQITGQEAIESQETAPILSEEELREIEEAQANAPEEENDKEPNRVFSEETDEAPDSEVLPPEPAREQLPAVRSEQQPTATTSGEVGPPEQSGPPGPPERGRPPRGPEGGPPEQPPPPEGGPPPENGKGGWRNRLERLSRSLERSRRRSKEVVKAGAEAGVGGVAALATGGKAGQPSGGAVEKEQSGVAKWWSGIPITKKIGVGLKVLLWPFKSLLKLGLSLGSIIWRQGKFKYDWGLFTDIRQESQKQRKEAEQEKKAA